MIPTDFIRKWQAAELKERSAAQEHFIDLCRLLGEATPAEADPLGEWFCFEKGAKKTGGGDGWADVWKRGYFGWEYKGKQKDLGAALRQLQQYALALDNPPLLIVSNIETIEIHTNFTNTVAVIYRLTLDDLADPDRRSLLKQAFTDPEQLRPGISCPMVTENAADLLGHLAQRLRGQGHDPQTVAHFINRLVFCLFAEDVGLLPDRMLTRLLEQALIRSTDFTMMAQDLFRGMQSGGRVGFEPVAWFNGGLFDSDEALALDQSAIELLLKAARLDWIGIDPSIFGTLFERGLDPDKRSQLGAHYTDRNKIMLLVEPVIIRPLQREWATIKSGIAAQLDKAATSKSATTAAKARKTAQDLHNGFLERLRQVRILDPACGSGNFLYLALLALKDLERRTHLDAEALGLDRQFPSVGPECVKGIEINPYAAELARITVWIGEIQWMRRNGFDVARRPILRALDTIQCRDALLNPDGSEAIWPAAEFIVGNPPFLGGGRVLGTLGDNYAGVLRRIYHGRVPGGADLVCYWFEKTRSCIEQHITHRAGLVATNSIRGGANRKVLEQIRATSTMIEAWSDEPWINEGAAVRVSLVVFGQTTDSMTLNGRPVTEIYADLTGQLIKASGNDLTQTKPLQENAKICFIGTKKAGAFDIESNQARAWLRLQNPNGRPNSDVLFPWINGKAIVGREPLKWIIYFAEMNEQEASLYEKPFDYVKDHVYAERQTNREERAQLKWWQHRRPAAEMRESTLKLKRYIATPRVSKYRLFNWVRSMTIPDDGIYIFAHSDDTTFGVLHSRFHELWALRLGTSLGDANTPRYTPTTTFETFPFPEGILTDADPDARFPAIAKAARHLNELRENWLNPPEWVQRVPEVVPGYPDRLLPMDDSAAALLKKRTLTHLYNERPSWLVNVHQELDEAVAVAYGWQPDINNEEILRQLLALNQRRAA